MAALPELRALAESLMVDTFLIERVSTVGVEDGRGGITYPKVTVYEGKGKIQTFEPYGQTPNVGGATFVKQRYYAHIPWDAGEFEPGDVVKLVASRFPVSAVGRKYRVAGVHEKTLQTAQRLLVDELVKGPINE